MSTAGSTFLYLVRHGETPDNAAGIFQGQAGGPLNARGRAQAGRLADRVRKLQLTAAYASNLARAQETATIAIDGAGLVLDLVLDEQLREVDIGKWTGKGYREVAELFPEEWAAWSEGIDVRRGGGETYAELGLRVSRAIDRIAERHAGGRVLVVSHGGSIKSFVARILGVSPDGMRALAGVGNCGITVLERDARGRPHLHAWNDTAHLEGLLVDETTD